MDADRVRGGGDLRRIGPGGGGFSTQLFLYSRGKIRKVALALEVPPREKIAGVAAAGGGVAVGGKVQADGVQQRGSGSLKAVPVAGHQAAALLVLDHQRLGGVPARQVCLGKTRVGNDFDVRRDVQCVQRADRVRRGTVAPVLPVQQGDGLAAAQTQRPREGVDEHLVAEAPGQFGVDHACPPSLSYSCSMRRAAVFSSYPAAESAAQWSS